MTKIEHRFFHILASKCFSLSSVLLNPMRFGGEDVENSVLNFGYGIGACKLQQNLLVKISRLPSSPSSRQVATAWKSGGHFYSAPPWRLEPSNMRGRAWPCSSVGGIFIAHPPWRIKPRAPFGGYLESRPPLAVATFRVSCICTLQCIFLCDREREKKTETAREIEREREREREREGGQTETTLHEKKKKKKKHEGRVGDSESSVT